MVEQFYILQFNLEYVICLPFKCQTVLFEPLIRPYQELTLRVRVDSGAIAIFQSSSITGASPSDCFMSYLRHSLGLTILQRYSRRSRKPQSTGLGKVSGYFSVTTCQTFFFFRMWTPCHQFITSLSPSIFLSDSTTQQLV